MWKLGQRPVFEYEVNKRFDLFLNDLPNFMPEERSMFFKTMADMVTAQSTRSQSGMSFEEYKKARMGSSLAR
jgi:hypothetical protein